jgi:hypothetical protein
MPGVQPTLPRGSAPRAPQPQHLLQSLLKPPGRDRRVAEHVPLDLAAGCLGQLVDELDRARVGVGGRPRLTQLRRQRRRGRLAWLEHDERLDRLTTQHIGHADRGGLSHGRMRYEAALDLGRTTTVARGAIEP